jgi:hypothetical protein
MAHTGCPGEGGPFMIRQVVLGDQLTRYSPLPSPLIITNLITILLHMHWYSSQDDDSCGCAIFNYIGK